MIKSISKRKNEFIGQSLECNRLSYAIQRGFYTIPANVGAIIDTSCGLRGTMPLSDKNPDNALHGPFGFSAGILFSISGIIIGEALNAAVATPAVLGSGLDWALGLDNIAAARGKDYQSLPRIFWVRGFHFCFSMLNLAHVLMSAYCYRPPESMSGAFGMLFGVVFECLRFIAITLIAYVVATLDYLTDVICLGITLLTGNSAQAQTTSQSVAKPAADATTGAGTDNPAKGTPPPQQQSQTTASYSDDPEVNEAINKGVDIYFVLFESTFAATSEQELSEDEIKQAFKKQVRAHHADKNKANSDEDIMRNAKLARDILLNSEKRDEYNLLAEVHLNFSYPSPI